MKPGDLVFTPFGGTGTVVEPKSEEQSLDYHTLVELDDPENLETVNPKWFMTATLESAPKSAEQLSLLGAI